MSNIKVNPAVDEAPPENLSTRDEVAQPNIQRLAERLAQAQPDARPAIDSYEEIPVASRSALESGLRSYDDLVAQNAALRHNMNQERNARVNAESGRKALELQVRELQSQNTNLQRQLFQRTESFIKLRSMLESVFVQFDKETS